MRILYRPQYNPENKFKYSFDREMVNVEYIKLEKNIAVGKEIVIEKKLGEDFFDFSTLPDGELSDVETILPVNPIISAKREDGVLWVELLNFIDLEATEEEKFPQWQVIE